MPGIPGPDEQHLPLRQVAQGSIGQLNANLANRAAPIAADVGVVVYPAAHPQCLVKETRQGAADVSWLAGGAKGGPHLAQNLPFPHYHGIQPAGHPEEMLDAIAFLVMVAKGLQVGPGNAGVIGDEILQPTERFVGIARGSFQGSFRGIGLGIGQGLGIDLGLGIDQSIDLQAVAGR